LKTQPHEDTTTSTKLVGGKILELDKVSLLIAGVQTNLAWLIPVLLAAGIGLFVVSRKSAKNRTI